MSKAISLFKTPEGEAQYLAAYNRAIAHWPVPFETLELPTRLGSTHAIVCGPEDAPALLLLHGNFASAAM